ncbi:MAG: 6,7-dimethyl-8-ribityllumazine synthase [Gammaproteobacteria bacterium]|nr:6,7-dimethyl-8-ribityllumazine synthase [Gammaproteobacteria bacterium]MYD79854.1 6,7-dimethyl-8-ribityllumazine synthase [Gammaproteobacteria bacterium]
MARKTIDVQNLPMIQDASVAILLSKWYPECVEPMHDKCREILLARGARVTSHLLPGTFEFPFAAQTLAENDFELEGIICLSVVVKGETRHFEAIVDATTRQLSQVSCESAIVIINEILPVLDIQHAMDRSEDDQFNKGIEAAVAAIEMIDWYRNIEQPFEYDNVDFH